MCHIISPNIVERFKTISCVHVELLHDLVSNPADLGRESANQKVGLGQHVDVGDDASQGAGTVASRDSCTLGHCLITQKDVLWIALPTLAQHLGVVSGHVDATDGNLLAMNDLLLFKVLVHVLHVLGHAMKGGFGANFVSPSDVDADHGVFELLSLFGTLEHGLEFGLRSKHVLEKLRHPPDNGVAMKSNDAICQVLGDAWRQELGPGVDRVHDAQLDDQSVGPARPAALVTDAWVGTGLTEGKKDVFEAGFVVPPAFALQDQHPLSAVGHDEAVDGMVDLAPVAAAFV